MLKSKGPRTANIDHGATAFTPGGKAATSHTADNSAGVRVTEKNSPCMTQCGSGSPGGQRQIAYEPGTRSRVRLCIRFRAMITAGSSKRRKGRWLQGSESDSS